jgi:hypothetical protein
VGPRAGLDDVENILDHTGTRNSDLLVVQPVGSRYTDCAIPTHGYIILNQYELEFNLPDFYSKRSNAKLHWNSTVSEMKHTVCNLCETNVY